MFLVGTDKRGEQMEILPALELSASLRGPRSRWRYPLIGAAAGAAAGTVLGIYVMARAEDYLAPPAFFVTAPLGAAVGALIGLAANAAHPPR
jgi:hypothetical protein